MPQVQTSKTSTTASLQDNLLRILVDQGNLNLEQASKLEAESLKNKKDVIELIEEGRLVREEDLVKARGRYYNVPYIDLFGRIIRAEVLNIIPPELASNYQMVSFNKAGNEVSIAMVNPIDFKALEAVEFIARKNRFKIKYHIVSKAGLKYILRQYESLSAEVEEALKKTVSSDEISKFEVADEGMEEVFKSAPVSKMVSVILRHAVEGKASDVHIEPVGNETRVRYRVDGVLHTSLILPKNVHPSIVARIKVISNLKIDETRIPQDGRFRMKIEDHDVDYRVSILPLVNNEKVVMRILDTSAQRLDLTSLGFSGKGLESMKEGLTKSHGMILITGPTGSGKSTTLYAMLSILNEEGVNIITLEDPVEYYIQGVNQSQINPEVGLTFAAGLRSILRQDPDIIMVGEIRDNETAELAVHAALTGHIVLSTLHTNDAFGAIPRMVDMKIEPFLLSSSINVIIAQRLVRKICPYCQEKIVLPPNLEEEIWQEVAKFPKAAVPKDVKLEKPLTFYRGKGCVRCENNGYKGRLAIAEVLAVTDKLKKIIVAGSDLDKMKEEFLSQGMFSMKLDGIFKALKGLTTIEEVLGVTRE